MVPYGWVSESSRITMVSKLGGTNSMRTSFSLANPTEHDLGSEALLISGGANHWTIICHTSVSVPRLACHRPARSRYMPCAEHSGYLKEHFRHVGFSAI